MNKEKLNENNEGIKSSQNKVLVSSTNLIPSMRDLIQKDCDDFVDKIKKERGK